MKEQRMWKLEGEHCERVQKMVDDYAERASFLDKAARDARKRLDDFIQNSQERIWGDIKKTLGIKPQDGCHFELDVNTSQLGFILVREVKCTHNHPLMQLLGL